MEIWPPLHWSGSTRRRPPLARLPQKKKVILVFVFRITCHSYKSITMMHVHPIQLQSMYATSLLVGVATFTQPMHLSSAPVVFDSMPAVMSLEVTNVSK